MKKEIVKYNEYIKNEFYSQPMGWISEELTELLKDNMDKITYNEDETNYIDYILEKAQYKTNKKIMEMLQNVYNSINCLTLGNGNITDIRHELGKLSILLIIVLNKANKDFLAGYSIDEAIKCESRETTKSILENFIVSELLKTNILLSSKKW